MWYRFWACPKIHLTNRLHVLLLSIVNVLVVIAHVDFLLDWGDVTWTAVAERLAAFAHGRNGRFSDHTASLNSLKFYISVGRPCQSQQRVHPTCFGFVMLRVLNKLPKPLLHHWVNQTSVWLVGMLVVFGAVLVQLWMVASLIEAVIVNKTGLIMSRKMLGSLTDVCMAISFDRAGEVLGWKDSWLS